jgi:MFS family permease
MDPTRARRSRHPFGGQTLRAFYTPGFWRIWAGSMSWYSARWMELFVLQWQVLVMTDSPFQVSLIGFYRMAPLFFFGVVSGVIADRFDRRKVVLFAQVWNGTAAAAIAVLALMDWLALWHLAILVMALGLGWALDLPSRRAFIYDMMGPRRIVNALALDHLGMDGAKMLGPILGGLLWPVIGLGGCFLILAAGYAVNFFLYRGLLSAEPRRATNSGPVLRNLAEGLAYVLHHPVILGVLAITVVLNFLGFPYQNLVPVVAKQDLGLGPQLTGALLATEGLGAICGSLFVASRREVPHKGRVFIAGSALVLGAVLLFSFSSWPGISFFLLFIAGAGIAGFATMQSSLILLSVSDAMRGRAMGTLILAIGFGPLGAIQIGVLASTFGVAPAIAMTIGAGLLLLVAILWWNTALWHFGSDSRQSPPAPAKAPAA